MQSWASDVGRPAPLEGRPSSAISLTPGGSAVRLPTPDVARGFMLLLIALANVEMWTSVAARGGRLIDADRVWLVLRTGLIDSRSYPLFAFLFGFGVAVMSRWRAGQTPIDRLVVRKTLRRRGLWLMAFGGVHALMFPGDVLGTYGLVLVILAGAVAARKWVALIIVGSVVMAAAILIGVPDVNGAGVIDDMLRWWPLMNLAGWSVSVGLSTVITAVVPAMVLGVAAADRGWLVDVAAHRARFAIGALLGLGLGFAASLPVGLRVAGLRPGEPSHLASMLNSVGTVASTTGWVCLMAVLAGRLQTAQGDPERQLGLGLVAAVGRRSLTAYLLQSVLFLGVWFVARLTGATHLGRPIVAAAVAAAVWVVTVVVCHLLAVRERPGPADQALRWLVRRTARPVRVPLMPPPWMAPPRS